MRPSTGPRRAPRPGITLIEMLIVLILFGIVVGGLMRVIRGQQAFYRSTGQMMEVRSQNDQALGILPRDLRAASSVDGDITAFSDSAITFRSQLGSSVLCAKTTNEVVIPPVGRLFKRHRLTVWREAPTTGDEILIFDEGPLQAEIDDSWKVYSITNVAEPAANSSNACQTTTGFVVAADTAKSFRYTVSPNLSATIGQGAPIRFGRKVRYALYQAADAQWYLGWQDSTNAGWTTRSPVSGPHRAYSETAGESGLEFVYYDAAGNELDPATYANRLLVAQVDLTIRGITRNDIEVPGKTRQQFVDSLVASVNLRNRQ